MLRLRAVTVRAQAPSPPQDNMSDVQQLRGQVTQFMAQIDRLRAMPSNHPEEPAPKRSCRQEDFVPHCDEEMQEWMEGRHRDLHSAMASGRLLEVARISSFLKEVAQDWQSRQADMSDDEIFANSTWRGTVCPLLSHVTTWGYRGVKVGEASHPGPGRVIRCRGGSEGNAASCVDSDTEPLLTAPGMRLPSDDIVEAMHPRRSASNPGPMVTRQGSRLERPTQNEVSYDEEPVRQNWGRHVVPRRGVEEEVPPTVPATPNSLARAGRDCPQFPPVDAPPWQDQFDASCFGQAPVSGRVESGGAVGDGCETTQWESGVLFSSLMRNSGFTADNSSSFQTGPEAGCADAVSAGGGAVTLHNRFMLTSRRCFITWPCFV